MGQKNSRRAGVTSAAAPQVHRGEQQLLLRDLHPLLRFWKPHREPTVPEPPGIPAVRRGSRSHLGERKRSEGQVWGRRDVLLSALEEGRGECWPRSWRQVPG